MAEIDLVPKHRSRVWPWVVLVIAIIIALIIWAFAGTTQGPNQPSAMAPPSASVMTPGLVAS